jgi:phospholipid/cholesterol/gamma-HCH transport system substrate-binding protein
MSSPRASALRVGLVTVAAGAVLVAILLRLDATSGLFDRSVRYRTRFSTTLGLAEGAEVRFRGVTVGKVERIKLAPESGRSDVVVAFSVREDVVPHVDLRAVAELKSDGPLGNKLLELRRDDAPLGEPLPAGSFVQARQPIQLAEWLDQGTQLFDNITSISKSLDEITTRLVAGEGVFGRLLKDKEFGDATIEDFSTTLRRVRELLDNLAEGRGVAGALLADEQLAKDMHDSAASLRAITARLENGEGALGQLLTQDSDATLAVADLSAAAASVRKLSDRLASNEGLAQRMIWDEAYADAVAEDLRATVSHLRSISEKLDEGKGTAGLLVNDPGIYDGMNDIVRGIKKSWFISFILKRKHKKGFADRVDQILRESPNPDADLLQLVRESLEVEEGATAPSAHPVSDPAEAAPRVDADPDRAPPARVSFPRPARGGG